MSSSSSRSLHHGLGVEQVDGDRGQERGDAVALAQIRGDALGDGRLLREVRSQQLHRALIVLEQEVVVGTVGVHRHQLVLVLARDVQAVAQQLVAHFHTLNTDKICTQCDFSPVIE